MKKLRLKGMNDKLNCSEVIQRCVATVDGLEDVHVDLATGLITYSPGTCTDDSILKEALAQEGLTAEEVKE